MTKIKKGFLAALVLIIGVLLILSFAGWMLEKQKLVAEGLAKSKFPYPKYTQEELTEIYGEHDITDVITTQSPEQTHAIFMFHLKGGEIDEAVECCFRRGDWEDYKEIFNKNKEAGKYDMMVEDLTVIKKHLLFDATATYVFSAIAEGGVGKVGGTMRFIKDSSGKWFIKSF